MDKKRGRPKKTEQQEIDKVINEIETTQEKVEETKPIQPPAQSNQTTMTSEERAIAERIAKPDTSWQTITEADMEDFSLMKNKFDLPPEAKKLQDEKVMAFHWIERKPSRFDEVTNREGPARLWPCNATNTPTLMKYIDPIHGGVQRENMLLMFRPWKLHRIYQDAKMEMANAKAESSDMSKLDGVKDGHVEWTSGDRAQVGKHDTVIFTEEDAVSDSP